MSASTDAERPAGSAVGAHNKPNIDVELGRMSVGPPRTRTRITPDERSGNEAGIRRRHSTGSFNVSQKNRRRSSILADLARAVKHAMPTDDSANSDDGGNVPDIPQKFNALFERLCDERQTSAAKCEALIVAWRRENFGTLDDPQILSFFEDALPSMMARHVQLEQNQRVAKKKTVFWTVMLTFFDTLSDYSAYIVLEMANSDYAKPMLVVLLVSMIMQALVARFVTKEGPVATVGALLGLKPILDGVNIIFDIPPHVGALHSLAAFGYTRAVETASESIPFAIMQSLALVEQRSTAQWISFAISVGNIAHAVASVDHSFDTSAHFRAYEPLVYGCYPPGARGDGLFASTAIFAFGYVTAKLVALAVFGTVARASLALALIGENVALLMLRVAARNWRWFNVAGDNTSFSLVGHFLATYPCMLAAPFPVFRHPFMLSPSIYAGFIA